MTVMLVIALVIAAYSGGAFAILALTEGYL